MKYNIGSRPTGSTAVNAQDAFIAFLTEAPEASALRPRAGVKASSAPVPR